MVFKQQLITVAILAVSVAAQNGVASTGTISAFLPAGVTASAMEVDCPATTLALDCWDSPLDICSEARGLGVSIVDMTIQPTGYVASWITAGHGGAAEYTEGCDYLGPYPSFTAKTCSMSSSVAAQGSVLTTSVSTLISSKLTQNPIFIASGAQILPSPSCKMTVSSTSAASSSSFSTGTSKPASAGAASAAANPTATTGSSSSSKGAAAAATAVPVVYKVLVPIGAVVAAGAAFL